jgi:hypothetical protein
MFTDFKVADRRFKLEALKLREALQAEAILVQAIFPVGAAFASGRVASGDLKSALVGIGPQVQTLVDLFAGSCEVDWQGGSMVPLASFLDLVFERKNAVLLCWLMACVEWQFADFFDGTGLPLLKAAASRFMSLIGSTGESGESQPPKK